MTTATRQRIQVPNLTSTLAVDKEGNWTAETLAFFNQLIPALQYILSVEGFRLPSVPQSILSKLTIPGAVIYSSDTHKGWINLNGVFHEIAVV